MKASTTCSTPRPSSSSSTPPVRLATTCSRNTRAQSTTSRSASPRLRGLFKLRTGDRPAVPDRRGRAGFGDREAVLDRRDELRVDLCRGPRDPGDRDEPARRQVQHRRGRRGSAPLRGGRERRPPTVVDQAGRVGPLRGHLQLPDERGRHPDQDGPGCQARRGRPAARPQGLPVGRRGAALDAGSGTHLAASAPRHLLHRGPGAAHPRPEELESRRLAST